MGASHVCWLGWRARVLRPLPFPPGMGLGLVGALPLPIYTPVTSSLNVFFCLQIDGGKLWQAATGLEIP